ncbi:MAG: hypothetical protein J5803_06145, partial [Desulfovibrio sp.]|nr:hypothetical protein [Desulfovibrio sp.]
PLLVEQSEPSAALSPVAQQALQSGIGTDLPSEKQNEHSAQNTDEQGGLTTKTGRRTSKKGKKQPIMPAFSWDHGFADSFKPSGEVTAITMERDALLLEASMSTKKSKK